MSDISEGNERFGMARVREDIAAAIGIPAAEVGPDDSLMDLGLDSIRAMLLASQWSQDGATVDFAALAETPTLRAWCELLQAGHTAGR